MRRIVPLVCTCLFLLFISSLGQELSPHPQPPVPTPAAASPNADPTYQQLRRSQLSDVTLAVHDFVLRREAGTFTFHSGTFSMLAPVNGKITGAVFLGDGSFTVVPPSAAEQRSLSLLTKEARMEETFNELVLRFTDGTADEIQKAGTPAPTGGNAGAALDHVNTALRKHLHYNLHARILRDVLGTGRSGLFVAFVKGRKYDGRMLYIVDPSGLRDFLSSGDDVALLTWDESKYGIWVSFRLSSAGRGEAFKIDHQKLDTSIEKSGRLNGNATTALTARFSGVRVLDFDLFPSLRVQSVSDLEGHPLAYIQENKDEDPDFAVILPRALEAGEQFTFRTVYSGKEAVRNEGGDNYYPVARSSWYPSRGFGDYVTYEMTFHIPKGMTMVATGNRVREINEGGENLSEWRTEAPQAVAGFNFGRFKHKEVKLDKLGFVVEAYANQEQPGVVQSLFNSSAEPPQNPFAGNADNLLRGGAVGNLNTTAMLDKALAEGQLAVELYTDYFGPSSYKRLAITQQTAFGYGQSWPTLVYLPISYFFDSTARHGLHMDDPRGYFKVVGPHEVAHQWWGHTVGFDNYRDQWMSEGFADFSASLFIQLIQKNNSEFVKFWNDERDLLLEKNKEGFRAIDVGPLTQGYRLATTKSGFDVPRRLIYPKGAYVLHMIRMMMWNARIGDSAFKNMMQDFVKTYANRSATTEDFKAAVEKHMTPGMDLRGNHTMDWFFDEYVYGTALPSYKLDYSFSQSGSDVIMDMHLTQWGVDDKFSMLVPIYLELADGRMVRLGAAGLTGNQTVDRKVSLAGVGIKDKPKRAMLNYFDDVLCTRN